jgi:hypothetical protein
MLVGPARLAGPMLVGLAGLVKERAFRMESGTVKGARGPREAT